MFNLQHVVSRCDYRTTESLTQYGGWTKPLNQRVKMTILSVLTAVEYMVICVELWVR